MQETCYCGRTGDIGQRNLVTDGDGREALQCPECGHMDHLSWLPEVARERFFADARRAADERSASAA